MNRLPPELDIPVLTDVIDEDETHHVSAAAAQVAADDADTLQHLEDAIVNRLMVQLSNRIPLLLETALREQLPDMITVRLQTALVAALETVMPAATHSVRFHTILIDFSPCNCQHTTTFYRISIASP